MILPYNVDRPARLTPTITYALMAANVLVYLLGIGYTNYKMYTERPETPTSTLDGGGQEDAPSGGSSEESGSSQSSESSRAPDESHESHKVPGQTRTWRLAGYGSGHGYDGYGFEARGQSGPGGEPQAPSSDSSQDESGDDSPASYKDGAGEMGDMKAMIADMERLSKTSEGREQLWKQRGEMWNLAHVGDALALDTHPDIMRLFAYLTVAPSAFTMLSSMFLHGDLMHLLGNLLFLWVFGRATEDTLGRGIYLGAYFVCGIAAILLYHVVSTATSPGLMIPFVGASGAIMGVVGLFAPRFYRTPVRVFYTNFMGARIFYLGTFILGGIFARALGLGSAGVTFAALIVLAGIVLLGDETLWGEWKAPAAWVIGIGMLVQDVGPALFQMATGAMGGGVAHWAHIGGFGCGVVYAFLIGAQKEGKTEYLVDEARQSLDNKYAGNAIERAQQVVMMKPDDPVGYQLLAEAFDRKENKEEALKNYKLAVDKYLRKGERSAAGKLYQEAMKKHAEWILDAPTLFVLASQMAKDGDWKSAAESLAKIPYYYPEASEGEMCFVRSAQIYLEKLDNPLVAMQLIYEFGNRYPESQWMSQATKLYEAANLRQSGAPAV